MLAAKSDCQGSSPKTQVLGGGTDSQNLFSDHHTCHGLCVCTHTCMHARTHTHKISVILKIKIESLSGKENKKSRRPEKVI